MLCHRVNSSIKMVTCSEMKKAIADVSPFYSLFFEYSLLKSHFMIQVPFCCYLNARNFIIFLYLLFSDPWECHKVHF